MAVEFAGSIVVPTIQFGNIAPSFSVWAPTWEEARNLWLKEARRLYQAVGKDFDLDDKIGGNNNPRGQKLVCFASGTEVYFEPLTHTYSPGKWLSGSAFANKFKSPFPAEAVSSRMGAKHDVDPVEIRKMWSLKGEASSSLGTAIHAALQLYGEHKVLSQTIKGSDVSALHDNPMLVEPVTKFFAGREEEKALYEAFCADPGVKGCGLIDRVLLLGGKKCRIQDFKTNTDIAKPVTVLPPFKGVIDNTTLGVYWLQLSYYSHLISQHGWSVEGLDIFHWTGKDWDTYTHDVIDVSLGFK